MAHNGAKQPQRQSTAGCAVRGLSREQLYRSFSAGGNPTLRTTLAVMKALGIELTAKPAAGR